MSIIFSSKKGNGSNAVWQVSSAFFWGDFSFVGDCAAKKAAVLWQFAAGDLEKETKWIGTVTRPDFASRFVFPNAGERTASFRLGKDWQRSGTLPAYHFFGKGRAV